MTSITDHLDEIRTRISRAASRAGRGTESVSLLAVSKGHDLATIQEAWAAGVTDFGENYLHEAMPKISAGHRDMQWHFIGRIQSNKTRDIAANFAWAQTVTTARSAERLSSQRPHYGTELQVCIQVQPVAGAGSGAVPRGGCPRAEVSALAELVTRLPRLRLRGLMLIPHPDLGTEELRMEFRQTRQLFDGLRNGGHAIDTLSMGMSDDFELAVEEGSTMVRIGTALFGPRQVAGDNPAGRQT
ncbi:MAG: YggS family pyridoxal phosphate-dependent enzyme [Chromatiales bacterium]|nr:YggS family pyridoxal phosphate-dependent enzyme [Chromatiales bacterium]